MQQDYSFKRPEGLLVREEGDVVSVTLNRPEIHNAFDETLIADLHVLFRALAGREDIRAVVLTGAGSGFSAGADLNWMKRAAEQGEEGNFDDAMRLSAMMDALYNLPMTTIAKVNGTAMGGGLGLCTCCDIAVASEKAVFALSEVRLGLVPGVISPYVIQTIGTREAHRWFQTGERIGAAEALRIGLVHTLCPPEELDGRVAGMIRDLRRSGPGAVRNSKALLRDIAGRMSAGGAIDADVRREAARRIVVQRASAEGREGLAAFLDKRKPDWSQE